MKCTECGKEAGFLASKCDDCIKASQSKEERLENSDEATHSTGGMAERVGFGPRFMALLIDLAIIIIVGGFLAYTLEGIVSGSQKSVQVDADRHVVDLAGGTFMMIAYVLLEIPIFGLCYNLLEGFAGASPGKMILGCKIRHVDGTKAGIGQLLLRYAIKNLAMICLLISSILRTELSVISVSIGMLWVLGCFLAIGNSKQGLHDLLVKTAVYPKKSL